MSRKTTVMAADAANTVIFRAKKPRNAEKYNAMIHIMGTFGSGTVTLFISPNAGTNKNPLDVSGTAISVTAAKSIPIELTIDSAISNEIIGYATLAGATNPSITIIVDDNV